MTRILPHLEVLASALIFTILVLGAYYTAQHIEYKHYPMIDKFKIRYLDSRTNPGVHSVTLWFKKTRECPPILDKFTWYVTYENSYQKRLYFRIPDDSGSVDRPTGLNFSPGWIVDLTGFSHKDPQTLTLYHNCFGLWDTKTKIHIANGKVVSINDKPV